MVISETKTNAMISLGYPPMLLLSKMAIWLICAEESRLAANDNIGDTTDTALVEAQSQLDKEDDDLERALSGIAVQVSYCSFAFSRMKFHYKNLLNGLQVPLLLGHEFMITLWILRLFFSWVSFKYLCR